MALPYPEPPRLLIPAFEACSCGKTLTLVLGSKGWICDECGNSYPWPGIRPLQRVNGKMVPVLTQEDKARSKNLVKRLA